MLTKLLCASTAALIFLGGMVTSFNVGLSVPDWPTSFGYQMWNLPFHMWRGGAFYEHSHRVLASCVGLLTLLVVGWTLRVDRRRWVRRVAAGVLLCVVLQGVLGGLTVLLHLPLSVSVLHGVLAQGFFLLTIVLAYSQSRERAARARRREAPRAPSLRHAILLVLAAIFAQLVLGALMRHDMKPLGGVAIPDFPRAAGQWLPRFDTAMLERLQAHRAALSAHRLDLDPEIRMRHVAVHYLHRLGALAVLAAAAWLAYRARRDALGGPGRRTLTVFHMLLTLQIALGIVTVWTQKGEILASLHVVTGALLWGAAVLLALRVWPVAPPKTAEAL